MNLTQKIAVAAGALVLTATGIAAAGSPPDAADKGLTTAEENVGVDLPVAKGADPAAPETEDADTTAEDAELEDAELEAEGEGVGPVDNHGAEVSAVAHEEFDTGREHGEAVSTVARDNHGAQQSGRDEGSLDAATDDDDDDEADDIDDDVDDEDADEDS